jgi:hypothetical protein
MRKKFLYLSVILSIGFAADAQTGSVGIGTTNPNSSAALDIQSSTKGVLIPRLTTAQRNLISSPATGLLVYDNTTNSFWFKSSNNWVELVDTMNTNWKKNGNNIYSSATANVGIGVLNPINRLEVDGNLTLKNGTSPFGLIRRWNPDDLNINSTMGNGTTSPGNLLLQIDQSLFTAGNVGVGMDNPSYKLSVNGDLGLYNDASVTGTLSNLSDDFLINAKAGSFINGTNPQHIILQYQTGLGTTSGRVGIGTATPSYKLDVSGDMRATGAINAGTSISTPGSITASGGISAGSITVGQVNCSGTLTSQGKITASAHLDLTGKLTRPLNTGSANLVPIAYGHVGGDGSILWGTGNFTVYKPTDWDGEYGITLTTGEDVTNALIMVQIVGNLSLKAATSKNDFGGYGETINANFVVGITRSDNNFWHNGAFYFVVFKL